jgi:hypothetical protein
LTGTVVVIDGAPASVAPPVPRSSVAFTMPAPHVLAALESHAPPENAVTFVASFSLDSTCAGVSVESWESISATTPATCGVAMLVPLYDAYVEADGEVYPVFNVDQMPSPGAAISTFGP